MKPVEEDEKDKDEDRGGGSRFAALWSEGNGCIRSKHSPIVSLARPSSWLGKVPAFNVGCCALVALAATAALAAALVLATSGVLDVRARMWIGSNVGLRTVRSGLESESSSMAFF